MKDKIASISKGMGSYKDRKVLTEGCIKETRIERLSIDIIDSPLLLHIITYNASLEDVKDAILNRDPMMAIIGCVGSEVNKAKRAMYAGAAQTLLTRERGKQGITCNDISLDLILAINNLKLLPKNLKLRCWEPYSEESIKLAACIFLDEGKSVINQEYSTGFYIKENNEKFTISYAKEMTKGLNIPNSGLLIAYKRNLEEVINHKTE